LRDFPEPVPYAVVIVAMEEGVRMVSGLRGLELPGARTRASGGSGF
jgi:hypothetical protein